MKTDNVVLEKSKKFALRVVNAYKYLTSKNEYVLSKQMLRSGTSIGANIKESVYAQSTADFISKLSIALKEAGETEYWIELLMESDYLTAEAGNSLKNDCVELIKLLTSIINSTKKQFTINN